MLYQLPSGKTVEISTEKYLDMSDTDLEYFIAYNHGEAIENPFFNSSLEKSPIDDLSDAEMDDYIEQNLIEIPDASAIEKLEDIDFDADLFEQ